MSSNIVELTCNRVMFHGESRCHTEYEVRIGGFTIFKTKFGQHARDFSKRLQEAIDVALQPQYGDAT